MTISRKSCIELVTLLTVAILPNIAIATPTVEGNVIKWTEDGWHQVQLQSTYESVCNGGLQCTVPTGVYTVINHGTGQRFMDIAVPNANPTNGNLPKAQITSTGQLVSYAAGDDGDYRLGVTTVGKRFQDNGDGTFEDTLTGLTWLSVRDCIIKFTWGPGIDYANNFSANSGDCSALADGSKAGDWRLPNIKELFSLAHLADAFPTWNPEIPLSGSWIDNPYDYFWSSTSFEPVPDSNAFALDGGVGLTAGYSKTMSSFYIWPVRDSK